MQIRVRRATINSIFADGLAASHNAPALFLRTSKSGLPYLSVLFCSLFTLLAFMAVVSGPGKVFNWFSSMTSIAGLMSWFGITITYLRFYQGLKTQGIDRRTLPFYTRFQPYAAWYGCCATFFVCLVSPLSHLPARGHADLCTSSADGACLSRVIGTLQPSLPTIYPSSFSPFSISLDASTTAPPP